MTVPGTNRLAGVAALAEPAPPPSMVGASLFVSVVFVFLATCFLASFWLLWTEFRDHDWQTLAIAHGHLFLFFPTFGILALVAFHLPSVVFAHLYWQHVKFGRVRFLFGILVALAATAYVCMFMLGPQASPRAIWEVAPQALAADRGRPAGCMDRSGPCQRAPIMASLQSLREKQLKYGTNLSKLARLCEPEALVEAPEENGKLRWCFALNRMATADECCPAQRDLEKNVAERVAVRDTRSVLADRELLLQAAKIFFVLVVLVIGAMLVVWRDAVERHYPHLSARIERNVVIGGFAMLLWPIMDYAYLNVTDVLFGKLTGDLQWRLSIVVAPWSLLLLFYFLRRFARNIEVLGQIVGVAGGLAAVLVRDELRDWAARFVGIGATPLMLGVMAALLVAGFVGLMIPIDPNRRHLTDGAHDAGA